MAQIPRRRPVRWWPAVTVVAVWAMTLAWLWARDSPHRQGQVLGSLAVSGGASILLAAWLFLLSRLSWLVRGLAALALGGIGVVAALTLEVRGFSGDLLPLVGWRSGARMDPASFPAAVARPASDLVPLPFDYPQFMGPARDGTVAGLQLARDWEREPPRLLWRQPLGAGWSGFAIASGLAVTQEQRGSEELVTCYDLRTGAPRWDHADTARFEEPISGVGPRATPSIHRGRIYALGATGILNALALETGARLWSRNVLGPEANVPTYGVAASPLVVDGNVVVAAGGAGRALVAYDAETGDERWAAGDDPPGYSSPLLAELAGRRQIVLFGDGTVVGYDPQDGRVLWRHPWPGSTEKVSQPVVLPPDQLFLSSGYGVGGKLFRLRATTEGGMVAELSWETSALKAKLSDVVHRAGHLYGLDDGILTCIGVADGRRRWKGGRYGHGQLVGVGDLLLVSSERGEVVLVEASAAAHRELGRFAAIEGKTWNHPALAGPFLVVRNDREAACYELALAD